MATTIPRPWAAGTGRHLSPQTALYYAWGCWIALLAAPFVLFLYVIWRLMLSDELTRAPDLHAAQTWFIAMVAYHVVVVPASIFARSRMFKGYYRGECVSPSTYLSGMVLVWLTLEIGGILSMVACLATRTLLPNLFPALVAFVVFVSLWPAGRVMVCRGRGDTDDPEKYEEPR